MKISGNDSIVIVNSYNQVAVYETFTGLNVSVRQSMDIKIP